MSSKIPDNAPVSYYTVEGVFATALLTQYILAEIIVRLELTDDIVHRLQNIENNIIFETRDAEEIDIEAMRECLVESASALEKVILEISDRS